MEHPMRTVLREAIDYSNESWRPNNPPQPYGQFTIAEYDEGRLDYETAMAVIAILLDKLNKQTAKVDELKELQNFNL